VAVEKVQFPSKQPKLGDTKCLEKLRKSFVGHPSAILFLLISRVGLFQHPRLVTTASPAFTPFLQLQIEILSLRVLAGPLGISLKPQVVGMVEKALDAHSRKPRYGIDQSRPNWT
jgi:hypothetical protein